MACNSASGILRPRVSGVASAVSVLEVSVVCTVLLTVPVSGGSGASVGVSSVTVVLCWEAETGSALTGVSGTSSVGSVGRSVSGLMLMLVSIAGVSVVSMVAGAVVGSHAALSHGSSSMWALVVCSGCVAVVNNTVNVSSTSAVGVVVSVSSVVGVLFGVTSSGVAAVNASAVVRTPVSALEPSSWSSVRSSVNASHWSEAYGCEWTFVEGLASTARNYASPADVTTSSGVTCWLMCPATHRKTPD